MALDSRSAALIAEYDAASKARWAEFEAKYGAQNNPMGASDSSTPASAINGTQTAEAQAAGITQKFSIPEPDTSAAAVNKAMAPAKASDAPKTPEMAVSGLCDALNKNQELLVKQGNYEVADVYEIIFTPAELGAAKMTKPGPTDTSRTAMQNNKSAKQKVDPQTNSVQKDTMTMSITAGTQIIQFIDKVMKNSTYISDQQIGYFDKNDKWIPNPANDGGQTAWYNVSLKATPIKYDNKRRDFAYKMTYVVSAYSINNMMSQYFPKSGFRGLHKSYKYWFTGQNTEVLSFEQDYNYLYRLIISGNAPNPKDQSSDSREVVRRIFQTASEQSMQGGDNKSTEPAANAADYLYSPSDQSKIKLKIIGDPAWIAQGDLSSSGDGSQDFNFQPFLPDGTININSQQVCFDISWNKPEDYDLNTGLVPVTKKNVNGQPQIDATYTAVRVKSYFSHGRFEQDLEGVLLLEYFENNKNNIGATTPTTIGANVATDGRTTQSSTTSSSDNSAAVSTGAAPAVRESPPANPVSSNGQDVSDEITPAEQAALDRARAQIAEAKASNQPIGDAVSYQVGEDRIYNRPTPGGASQPMARDA